MEKEEIIEALKKAKESSKKRNFKQSVDLIINLRDINLKNPEHQVNLFVQLPHSRGKEAKICALAGPELLGQAKSVCDNAISADNFKDYSNKKESKKLANEYDFFIAQATIMPAIATSFGRVLGPRGKMPNPKAGCVVPPNANLKPLYERLQNTVKIATKNDPIIQCHVGKEEMKEEDIADNVIAVYNSLVAALPNEVHNIKNAYIKLTMGNAVKISKAAKEEKE